MLFWQTPGAYIHTLLFSNHSSGLLRLQLYTAARPCGFLFFAVCQVPHNSSTGSTAKYEVPYYICSTVNSKCWKACNTQAAAPPYPHAGVYRAKPRPTRLSRRCHHFAVYLRPVAVAAVVGLIVLTFFEYPAWCNEATKQPCDDFVRAVPCRAVPCFSLESLRFWGTLFFCIV